MKFRSITISGEVCSGKSSIANALLTLLPDWKRVNTGQRFRDFCQAKGMTIQQVAQIPDEIHKEFDAYQTELLRTENNILVEGRLAGWLAHNLNDVYRVLCFAPVETRIQRYMSRDGASREQAIDDINYRDVNDIKKFKAMYGIEDYRMPSFYTLALDTSQDTPINLAKLILSQAQFSFDSQK